MNVAHGWSYFALQQFASLGERDAACCAMQQTYPEPCFHVAQALAQAGHRNMGLHRSPPEIPGPGHRQKGRQIAQIEIAHCSPE